MIIKNEKEYYNVSEVSQFYKVTSRNVRKIINQIKDKINSTLMLYKDSLGNWNIHHLLLSKFKPKNKKKEPKFWAVTIDPNNEYLTHGNIDFMIRYGLDKIEQSDAVVHYTIEKKKGNEKLHIHAYTNCKDQRKFKKAFDEAFATVSYHKQPVYDLDGWKKYITKEDKEIKTITKKD